MTKHEIWSQHPTYTNYEISTSGQVRRIYKNHSRKLTPYTGTDGYVYVTITIKCISHSRAVHRLVAQTFIPNPENKPQVNHLDGNKTNNNLLNLEWATSSENIMHSYKTKLRKPPHQKKIMCLETKEIYESIHSAERATGVCFANISACCRKKIKSAGDLHWRYL